MARWQACLSVFPGLVLVLLSPILLVGQPMTPPMSSTPQSNNHKNISDLLDDLLQGYDNSVRPDFGGPPSEVTVDINVRSMGPISEVDMTYSMDCYFRQSWVDRRLAFQGSKETLALSISMLERIWKPDTYFYNGKQSYLHTITTPNKFVRLRQDGQVLYSSSAADSVCGGHGSQDAILRELEEIIEKEMYHLIPIMESRQGFINLSANVLRVAQAGRDALRHCRECLRVTLESREQACTAAKAEKRITLELRKLQAEIDKQDQRRERTQQELEASQGREQEASQLVADLREQIAKQLERARAESREARAGAGGRGSEENAEDYVVEIEAMRRQNREQLYAEEIARLKDMLRSNYQEQDVLMRRISSADLHVEAVTEELTTARAALALNVRLKEAAETELKDAQVELEDRGRRLHALTTALEKTRERLDAQEALTKEATQSAEQGRKRADDLQKALDRELRRQKTVHAALASARDGQGQLRLQVVDLQREANRARIELAGLEQSRNGTLARMQQLETKCAVLEEEKRNNALEKRILVADLEVARGEHQDAERRVAMLSARMQQADGKRVKMGRLADQQARTLRVKQTLWDDLSREYTVVRRKARQDEMALNMAHRDVEKLSACLAEATLKATLAEEAASSRLHELCAAKREVAEARTEHNRITVMLESAREKQTVLTHEVEKQLEKKADLEKNLRLMADVVEQLKAQGANRERQCTQLEHTVARATSHAQTLRNEVRRTQTLAEERLRDIEDLVHEREKLQAVLRTTDSEVQRLGQEAGSLRQEMDVIGAQLSHRNDEIFLLREQIKITHSLLDRGDGALTARNEDVRLLKTEVWRLRSENTRLSRVVRSQPDMRAEMFRAYQDLTRSEVRLRALEHEMSVPVNMHRWRRLEGSDPAAHQLIFKVHLLQKRILVLSSAAVRRECQLREAEELYVSLRRSIMPCVPGLSKPYPDSRHRLKTRGRHLKVLIAEVCALEALADQKVAHRLLADLQLGGVRRAKRKACEPDEEGEEEQDQGQPQAKRDLLLPSVCLALEPEESLLATPELVPQEV